MINQNILHYKILEKLGEGGMGVVYKAQDTKLKRTVALKFLPPALTRDSQAKQRFMQEAQAASALDHINICTIYEIDETEDGQLFISMAFYDGETVREKIDRGPLKVAQAVDIAAQVAEALREAHHKGIVHRDIKPANVMITSRGRVKIMDFGLAKLAGQTKLTRADTTLGTVAYMSPEQARGERVDPRTDIWSWGAVLYEMLTGVPAFKGEYQQAVVYAILNEDPPPLTKRCEGVSTELDHLVRKALAKETQERYQNTDDLLADIGKIKQTLQSPAVQETTPELSRPSIAVLPFADLSPGKDQGYFCDGMAEEIINALAHVEGLRVVARTSAFAFKGKCEDIREIGRKLDVKTLLEGSVRKAGNRLRISTQLIDVADGYHIWSERFDRELEDVFAIQDEIAQSIAQALKVELSEKEKCTLRKTATKDVEAYDLYLRGRQFFYRTGSKNLEYALEMFSRAIQKDPKYALAYAGKANCHSALFWYYGANKMELEQSLTASQKALELDSELAEAHVARGYAAGISKQYDEAEREYEIAIRLNPKLFEAYYFYARMCFAKGKLEKAVELYEQACLVDSERYEAPILLAGVYKKLNLAAKAEDAARRGLRIVERQLELNPDDFRAVSLGAGALLDVGEREKSLKWLHRAISMSPENISVLYNAACLYSKLGRTEEAINYLERAIKTGFIHKEWIENDGDFDSIRSHPRYQALLEKLE
jgi:non-specific serine/threonine protein kinase